MACYFPSWAHHAPDGNLSHTKRPWPCGQCTGCRLQRAKDWATRCMHEAQLHEHNCGIRLSYNDENLPPNASLRKRDYTLFMKRLRNHFARLKQKSIAARSDYQKPIRFYMGGEYGDITNRPHYHAALFNLDFDDKKYYKKSATGNNLYISETLEKLWGHGHATINALTWEYAGYIARYIMKKQTGKYATKYQTTDPETGEIIILTPEYNNMSRRPGIGYSWFLKYTSDIYPQGDVIVNGHPQKAPRYYDKQYKKIDEQKHKTLQKIRQQKGDEQRQHKTPARLKVQHQVKLAQLRKLKREATQ